MLIRRCARKTAILARRPLLVSNGASNGAAVRACSGEIPPTPPTPNWAKPLRIANQSFTLERDRQRHRGRINAPNDDVPTFFTG